VWRDSDPKRTDGRAAGMDLPSPTASPRPLLSRRVGYAGGPQHGGERRLGSERAFHVCLRCRVRIMGPSEVDAGHLVVAVALTYLLGFERDLRGAPTGDRVFALVGAGSGVMGIIAAHGAPNVLAGAITGIGFLGGGLVYRQAFGSQQVVKGMTTAAAIFAAAAIGASAGQGRLLIAGVATALSLLVLEIRHVSVLSLLDGRHWARYFNDDEEPVKPDSRPND
jgi:putative Mg2+ transporter-C (MgtC) family protein